MEKKIKNNKLTVYQICNLLKITGRKRDIILSKFKNIVKIEKDWINIFKKLELF